MCVLIDEVESLTAARRAAVAGSEPADAVRAVNALLTQLDALKRRPNVLVRALAGVAEPCMGHVLADRGHEQFGRLAVSREHPHYQAKVYMLCAYSQVPFAVPLVHGNFIHACSRVMQVLTTSNITEAIDLAFVDRADIKAYIGNPGLQARLCLCTMDIFLLA